MCYNQDVPDKEWTAPHDGAESEYIMATMSVTALNNALRDSHMTSLSTMLTEAGLEPMQIATGKLACPVVDSEGNEKWVVFSVSIPKGTHDGEEFDGYSEAESYKFEVEEKAEKARVREVERKRKADEREAKRLAREAQKAEKANAKKEETEE